MTLVGECHGLVLLLFLYFCFIQIYVMQIRSQILYSVTFLTAEFPLVFNATAFSIFVVGEEHVIGAGITSDSGPKPARAQIS